MTNLYAHADENTVQFRTVSARMKSPQRFYITYGELDRLQRDGHIITNDIHSFARLWLDERRDRITFDLQPLWGHHRIQVRTRLRHLQVRLLQHRRWLGASGPQLYAFAGRLYRIKRSGGRGKTNLTFAQSHETKEDYHMLFGTFQPLFRADCNPTFKELKDSALRATGTDVKPQDYKGTEPEPLETLLGYRPVWCFPARNFHEAFVHALLTAPNAPDLFFLVESDDYVRIDKVKHWEMVFGQLDVQ